MEQWTLDDAAHLLRRAGFGGSMDDVRALQARGKEGAIAYLLNYESVSDPSETAVDQLGLDVSRPPDAVAWMLYRVMASSRPLQEKLTWFWHGHFTSALGKSPAAFMVAQNKTWRAHASGGFEAFLLAMYKDPAMLVYLDNARNIARSPNENFARELMELFTLGIGNYTETDVKEAARALTGWTVNPATGQALFVPRNHDAGSKTILGSSGNIDGDGLMNILARHPATATRICRKLHAFFVGGEVSQAELALLTQTWNSSGGNIKAVMNTLLHLDSFWSKDARTALVKSPMDYAVGLVQRCKLGPTVDVVRAVGGAMVGMGLTPYVPPDVAGYPQGLEWAGTSSLLARYNAANRLFYGPAALPAITQMTQGVNVATAEALVDALLLGMGPLTVTAITRQALVDYVNSGGYRTAQLNQKARGTLHLIASTPEYQLN